MKKIVVAIMLLVMVSTAMAAPYLLGTRKLPGEAFVYQTVWAHPKSSTTGLINTTGATADWGVDMCDTGSVIFETVTGTAIKNVAMQVAYSADETNPALKGSALLFTNAIGTTSAPYHPVTTADTDSHKFDFNSRGFNRWRLNCLAGCDLTNTISNVYGVCWRSGK
jgi:hypothetical protein